jgi:hypothetical protein
VTPVHESSFSKGLTVKKEAQAQGNNREEIPCKIVTVHKSPSDNGYPFQEQDLLMAAEEFKHPVEGFENTHEEYDNDEVLHSPKVFLKKSRREEKEKQDTQSKPFEKFDLRSKGNKGNRKSGVLNNELRIWDRENVPDFVRFRRKDLHHPG